MNNFPLEHFIDHIVSLTPSIKQEFLNLFQAVDIGKKQHLTRYEDRAKKIAYIQQGILRGYYVNPVGEEVTTNFFVAPTFAADYSSYLQNLPVRMNIQVLTPSVLLVSDLDNLNVLSEKHVIINKFYRVIVERAFAFQQERQVSFILNSATERYLQLIKDRKQIFEEIPQHYIASYLGIKPQSLSRIRKNLAKG
ncbi:hypothetical protein BKI52_34095 [marine bacterium AO1-C]|nr:hypothetical protein BKI52_34095 [marine bacterium AO1-C]